MQTLRKDLEFAVRSLLKTRAFTAIAVLTIALGVGASTAIFSVVNAVLLRPLPYRDADRLVHVWADLRARNVQDFPAPPGDYLDLREQATLFEDVAATTSFRVAITGDEGPPEQIGLAGATPNLLRMLGARITLGRDFVEDDGLLPPPNAEGGDGLQLPTIGILSHGFWQRRYGGDPSVIGRSIELDGNNVEVVGVLAPGFELLFPPSTNFERVPDVVVALRLDPNASRINVFLRIVGKLKPGVPLARAQAQVDAVAAELRERFPIKQTAGMYFRVESMREDLVADVRSGILALMGAVVFVLLIACANVANLLLVRAGTRERELAVRAALGGSRWRLVRQMLTESFVLAALGALVGLLIARLGIRLLLVLRPENLPRIESITTDPVVLGFTTLAAAAAALIFGTIPALRASRVDVAQTLREAGRLPGLGGGRFLRNAVVTAEVALSFVLLIGSGLMVRSFIELQRQDPGYEPNGVLTFVAQPAQARWQGPRRAVFMREVRERIAALNGVQAVTAAFPLPLDGTPNAGARWGKEEALTDPNLFQQASTYFVLPGYFEAMRTPVLEGRTFTEADNDPEIMRVVVDQPFAAKAFPNESAIGKRFLARVRTNEPEWFEIIGVVAHQRHETLAAPGREAIYFTDAILGHGVAARWAVRTEGEPTRLASAVRAIIAEIDPLQPVSEIQPMDAFVDRASAPTRFALVLIAVFAGIAALLAAVGLYGVLATMVRQRTAEIGVRMAFGAPRGRIFRLVVGEGLRLSGVGILIGLFAAFALTRVMSSMLVGVKPTDAATYAVMAVAFFVIAVGACVLPAQRAARLPPSAALRDG